MAEATIYVQSVVMAIKIAMGGVRSSHGRALVQRAQNDSMGAWAWIDTKMIEDSEIERIVTAKTDREGLIAFLERRTTTMTKSETIIGMVLDVEETSLRGEIEKTTKRPRHHEIV